MRVKKYYKLVRVDYEDSAYLRLKNVSNEDGVFKMVKQGSVVPNLEYSLDGVNWTTYDFTTLPEVTVAAGSNIYFRGTNANQRFNAGEYNYVRFSFNKTCEGHGNICSLFDPDPAVFSTINSIGTQSFIYLFAGMETLVTPPDFSSITSIGNGGMQATFQSCSSLETAPDLSNVTTIGSNGLNIAFANCHSLETAPDLSSVTSVGQYGLRQAFGNCYKLSTAIAPNISDLTQNDVLYNWLSNAGTQATGTKTVKVAPGATITTGSDSGIPTGWTRVDY